MKRRALAAFTLAVLAGCGGGGTAPTEKAQPVARIAITFDVHRTTYPVAFPMMRERGIPGTYFVEPDQIDATLSGELRQLQAAGWTIGAYSGVNMRTLADSQGPGATLVKLKALAAGMADKGFPATVLAPNQRAWGQDLAEQARGIFSLVRVCGDYRAFEDWPIPAPLYMDRGGTPSLSASDTVKSLEATLARLIADGGLWVVVIHKVGDDDPAYSVRPDVLRGFLDAVVRERDAGRIKVITL